jgi:RNase P subunit RPR2
VKLITARFQIFDFKLEVGKSPIFPTATQQYKFHFPEFHNKIMASFDLSARLQYLNDAAHLLATTAPSTSKYLMSARNDLMFDSGMEQPESLKRNACSACGTILVIGWQATLEVQSQSPRLQNQKPAKLPRKDMVYTCESCSRTTRIRIAPPTKKQISKSYIRHTPSTKQSITSIAKSESGPRIISANSSSKKRAKARKQGSLAAVLAGRNSAASTSGFGLDLMDFMKKV